MIKLIVQLVCMVLPWPLRRFALNCLPGFTIDPTARIGLTLILADKLVMARGTKIGQFNYVGKLDLLQMDEEAHFGNFNWISGLARRLNSPFYTNKPNRRSELVMGRCSVFMHRNFIDCTDKIELGAFCGIGGVRTQLLTHGIEPISSRQSCAPIRIGAYTMVGSGSLILKGVEIPDRCIVAAGSVVVKTIPDEYTLFAGNPATPIRKLPETAKLFHRTGSVVY